MYKLFSFVIINNNININVVMFDNECNHLFFIFINNKYLLILQLFIINFIFIGKK